MSAGVPQLRALRKGTAPRRISGSVLRWEKPSGMSATIDMRTTVRIAPRSRPCWSERLAESMRLAP